MELRSAKRGGASNSGQGVSPSPNPSISPGMDGAETTSPNPENPSMEDIMETDEERALLENAPRTTQPPSSQQAASPRNIKAILLAHRQQYKKTKSNLERAKSHLDFLRECRRTSITPLGLKIRKECHALLKEYTSISARFKAICKRGEAELLEALLEHYNTLVEKLRQELQVVELAMEQTASSNSDFSATSEHDNLLNKTNDNINALVTKLKHNKERKLRILQNPPQPRENQQRDAPTSSSRGCRGTQRTSGDRQATNNTGIGQALKELLEQLVAVQQPPQRGRPRWRGRGRGRGGKHSAETETDSGLDF